MKQTIIASTLALLIGIAGGWIGRTTLAEPSPSNVREAEKRELLSAMHRVCIIKSKWRLEDPNGMFSYENGYGPTPEDQIIKTGMVVEIPCHQVVEETRRSAK